MKFPGKTEPPKTSKGNKSHGGVLPLRFAGTFFLGEGGDFSGKESERLRAVRGPRKRVGREIDQREHEQEDDRVFEEELEFSGEDDGEEREGLPAHDQ